MCLVVMAARAATGATLRVVKADTARLEDATSRARDDMLTRMFVFLYLLFMSSSKRDDVRVAMISQKKESVMYDKGEDIHHHRLTYSRARVGQCLQEVMQCLECISGME